MPIIDRSEEKTNFYNTSWGRTRSLRLQRNLLLAGSVIMMFSNTLLALKLYNEEVITRNIPITDQEIIISNNFINDAALKIRADQILSLLFSMRKGNIDTLTNSLLRQVDSEYYLEFKAKIEQLAEDIRQRDYRYVFSDITEYEYNNLSFSVKVSGFLETYLSDKRISNLHKKYLLTFTNKSGIINLKSFEEVKNE